MPPLGKNKWLSLFLDIVRTDLNDINEVDWTQRGFDNLLTSEQWTLRELQEARHVVKKRSDKGGNVMLMDGKLYEGEVKRLLRDKKYL